MAPLFGAKGAVAAGEKPTQIAGWLKTFGFVGTGGTVNGFLQCF